MQVRNSIEENKLNQYYRNNIENAAKTKHKKQENDQNNMEIYLGIPSAISTFT